jgi:DNA recombination-dependent growth factor C
VKSPTTLRADWHGLTVWTLEGDWTAAVLLEALATSAFRPPFPDALVGRGWAPPLDVTAAMSHEACVAGNIVAVCWRVDTKKVPKTAVHTLTAQLCAMREMEAGGKLSKAEVDEVRE